MPGSRCCRAHPARALLGHVQRLGELCKIVVDGRLLQAAPVRRQALVQRDGVTLPRPKDLLTQMLAAAYSAAAIM